MIQIPYIIVPVIALCCYSFLLIMFMAAKKSKVIYSFMALLVAFIFWSSGSLFMRLQAVPGVNFWYEVSIIGLFLLPLLLYNFVAAFIGQKGYFLRIIYTICTAAILLAVHFHLFLKHPTIEIMADGQPHFIYDITWPVIFPMIFSTFVVISIIYMVVKDVKTNKMNFERFLPILIGIIILLIGNFMDVFPVIGEFPGDTLAGIINAGFMVYALYKRRLFNLTLLVSRSTSYIVTAIFVFGIFAYGIRPFERFMVGAYPWMAAYDTLIIAVLFAGISILAFAFTKKLLDKIFVKDELAQAELLKYFSQEVSKSLNLDDILTKLVYVVQKGVNVEKIYVCLPDEQAQCFQTVHSASPLDSKTFQLSFTNPCVKWLISNNTCMVVKEFQRTIFFKALWQDEKKQLEDLDIECLVPLKCDEELAGIVMLSRKMKNRNFSFDDINFLDSVNSVGSIAIKNARLYEKAYLEARYDDLTGLLNRKYFYETITEEAQKAANNSLALLIMNIDDFKLYNQLYGNREGDMALRNIAQRIMGCVGSQGIPARYSGKEFAVILPNFDAFSTINLAENIRRQVANMTEFDESAVIRTLTMSCGICIMPYTATTVKQLIENADMAVFNAKRSGKNKVEVYSLKEPQLGMSQDLSSMKPDVYSDYASTIYALTAAIDVKDHYTFNHSQKVAEYATTLAAAISLNDEHVEIIREAALLHDIGKIGIPESILNKQGKLTDDEYKAIKKHVENSIAMIRHLPSLDYVIPAVLGHHERWDGKGYPRGIAGEDIPISARCLAIADAFDAMTTERSYKKALSIEFAQSEINNQAGRQFDPTLASVFVNLIENNQIHI